VSEGPAWYPTASAADHSAVEKESKANDLFRTALGARLNT
jgi:hypothetical protein